MSAQKQHWEDVYTTKAPTAVSWYRQHLESSLALIERMSAVHSVAIIDVGGGESTLVDDLISRGYSDISVLDISETAIEATKRRLGPVAGQVKWLVGDLCEIVLPPSRYDIWHDRAVFHFLTLHEQRAAYVAKAAASVNKNGHLIISTFGPEGPTRCSGLDTARYDATALQSEFGSQFRLTDSQIDWHTTPEGGRQQFLCCVFVRIESPAQ
jgi:2-polyprenyl-3-methyl-5-hydroxy-6-metoxy-1,4-benzoquinol methylase